MSKSTEKNIRENVKKEKLFETLELYRNGNKDKHKKLNIAELLSKTSIKLRLECLFSSFKEEFGPEINQ